MMQILLHYQWYVGHPMATLQLAHAQLSSLYIIHHLHDLFDQTLYSKVLQVEVQRSLTVRVKVESLRMRLLSLYNWRKKLQTDLKFGTLHVAHI